MTKDGRFHKCFMAATATDYLWTVPSPNEGAALCSKRNGKGSEGGEGVLGLQYRRAAGGAGATSTPAALWRSCHFCWQAGPL